MQITPYAENKRGDRVYMKYEDGKPLSFKTIGEMLKWFDSYGFDIKTVSNFKFDVSHYYDFNEAFGIFGGSKQAQ